MEGAPGAQTVAAAAMVFKWAILVRHQILLHLPPNFSESVSDALSDPIHLVSVLVSALVSDLLSDWGSDLLFNSMDWCLTWSPM